MGLIIWLFEWWLIFAAIALVQGLVVLLPQVFARGIGNMLWRPHPREYGTDESRAAARAAAKPQRVIFWWL